MTRYPVPGRAPELSIVSTLYRSAEHLEEFVRRICSAAEEITPRFELILVDDGSPDDSQKIARRLCDGDCRIQLVELSRNYGHHKAIVTGLTETAGELVFLIDSDLEEAPEVLGRFYQTLTEHRSDAVYGVQRDRKGGFFERVSGSAFYRLFNLLSDYPVPRNLTTARLMTRAYVDGLIQHRDQQLFLAGLFAITGFEQVPLVIDKGLREGRSTYTMRRRLALLVNAVTSFSARPLVFIFWTGCVIVAVSGFAGVYFVVRTTLFGRLLPGFASLMISIWFLGGLSIFSLGVIGIYLSKIYLEVKSRPYTLVRSRYHATEGPRPGSDDREGSVYRGDAC